MRNLMKPTVGVLLLLAIAAPALAKEPSGCGQFKWPLNNERALLATATRLSSGSEMPKPFVATSVTLVPFADSNLPTPPSRLPRFSGSRAGFLRVASPKGGVYRITLLNPAWVDVVQDGHVLKSIDHTGARDCAGVAKSVKFSLAATPFVIELSGTSADSITFVMTPD